MQSDKNIIKQILTDLSINTDKSRIKQMLIDFSINTDKSRIKQIPTDRKPREILKTENTNIFIIDLKISQYFYNIHSRTTSTRASLQLLSELPIIARGLPIWNFMTHCKTSCLLELTYATST